MADQLTTVAKERLTSRVGALNRTDLKAVEHVLSPVLQGPRLPRGIYGRSRR